MKQITDTDILIATTEAMKEPVARQVTKLRDILLKKLKSECKENWEILPITSEHLWQGDHHGLPSGKCKKCGKSYFDYCKEEEVIIEKMKKSGYFYKYQLGEA